MASFCSSIPRFSLSISDHRYGVNVSPNAVVNRGFTVGGLRRVAAKRSAIVSCLDGYAKAAPVTGKSWTKLILESDTPVLVEFYASWCGPCRMVHRVIDEIATDYSGRIKVFVLDADHDRHIAEDYDIKAVPVVLLFKDGVKRDSVAGTMPKEFYVAAIERLLAS